MRTEYKVTRPDGTTGIYYSPEAAAREIGFRGGGSIVPVTTEYEPRKACEHRIAATGKRRGDRHEMKCVLCGVTAWDWGLGD